jgi:hypothetical protein
MTRFPAAGIDVDAARSGATAHWVSRRDNARRGGQRSALSLPIAEMSERNFFAELKRRSVYKVAVACVGSSVGSLQNAPLKGQRPRRYSFLASGNAPGIQATKTSALKARVQGG